MKSKAVALPYIIWMIVFIVVPLGMVVVFGFTSEDGGFTLQNVFKAASYANVFLKSMLLAAIATVISLVIAYPFSYIMSRTSASAQKVMMLLVMVPMWMNILLMLYAWMTIIGDTGLINQFLGLFGIKPIKMLYTQGAVVLGMVYNYLPFMIIPLYSIMEKIDNKVIEAAQDLGANGFKVFVKVILPLSVPGIVTGVTMVFVPAVSTFIISQRLGGISLIGDLIEQQFLKSYNMYLGSAMAIVLMVIMLICMGFINRLDDEDKEGMLI